MAYLRRRFYPANHAVDIQHEQLSSFNFTGTFFKFFHFGIQQAMCCIFPVCIFLLLAISKIYVPFNIPRYDFIFIGCMIIQFLMLALKFESVDEFKVISLFHVIGLALEVFKINMGSWSYPEFSFLKILNVPLYSGFMYASVASYICQAWRRFDLQINNWPSIKITFLICTLIYLNFFTHHFTLDLRWILFAIVVYTFRNTIVNFQLNTLNKSSANTYKMPLLISFLCIGFFIWIAENISTYYGAWAYPNQHHTWQMVHVSKISSWFLLVIISIVIVANLKRIKYPNQFN
jgi:uncharacterized membrane protein YoaT (DUF817 family)